MQRRIHMGVRRHPWMTRLSPTEEKQFRKWYGGRPSDASYDWRGFYRKQRAIGGNLNSLDDHYKLDPNFSPPSFGLGGKILRLENHPEYGRGGALAKKQVGGLTETGPLLSVRSPGDPFALATTIRNQQVSNPDAMVVAPPKQNTSAATTYTPSQSDIYDNVDEVEKKVERKEDPIAKFMYEGGKYVIDNVLGTTMRATAGAVKRAQAYNDLKAGRITQDEADQIGKDITEYVYRPLYDPSFEYENYGVGDVLNIQNKGGRTAANILGDVGVVGGIAKAAVSAPQWLPKLASSVKNSLSGIRPTMRNFMSRFGDETSDVGTRAYYGRRPPRRGKRGKIKPHSVRLRDDKNWHQLNEYALSDKGVERLMNEFPNKFQTPEQAREAVQQYIDKVSKTGKIKYTTNLDKPSSIGYGKNGNLEITINLEQANKNPAAVMDHLWHEMGHGHFANSKFTAQSNEKKVLQEWMRRHTGQPGMSDTDLSVIENYRHSGVGNKRAKDIVDNYRPEFTEMVRGNSRLNQTMGGQSRNVVDDIGDLRDADIVQFYGGTKMDDAFGTYGHTYSPLEAVADQTAFRKILQKEGIDTFKNDVSSADLANVLEEIYGLTDDAVKQVLKGKPLTEKDFLIELNKIAGKGIGKKKIPFTVGRALMRHDIPNYARFLSNYRSIAAPVTGAVGAGVAGSGYIKGEGRGGRRYAFGGIMPNLPKFALGGLMVNDPPAASKKKDTGKDTDFVDYGISRYKEIGKYLNEAGSSASSPEQVPIQKEKAWKALDENDRKLYSYYFAHGSGEVSSIDEGVDDDFSATQYVSRPVTTEEMASPDLYMKNRDTGQQPTKDQIIYAHMNSQERKKAAERYAYSSEGLAKGFVQTMMAEPLAKAAMPILEGIGLTADYAGGVASDYVSSINKIKQGDYAGGLLQASAAPFKNLVPDTGALPGIMQNPTAYLDPRNELIGNSGNIPLARQKSVSKETGIKNPWVGLGVDIITDPGTYIAFGAGARQLISKGIPKAYSTTLRSSRNLANARGLDKAISRELKKGVRIMEKGDAAINTRNAFDTPIPSKKALDAVYGNTNKGKSSLDDHIAFFEKVATTTSGDKVNDSMQKFIRFVLPEHARLKMQRSPAFKQVLDYVTSETYYARLMGEHYGDERIVEHVIKERVKALYNTYLKFTLPSDAGAAGTAKANRHASGASIIKMPENLTLNDLMHEGSDYYNTLIHELQHILHARPGSSRQLSAAHMQDLYDSIRKSTKQLMVDEHNFTRESSMTGEDVLKEVDDLWGHGHAFSTNADGTVQMPHAFAPMENDARLAELRHYFKTLWNIDTYKSLTPLEEKVLLKRLKAFDDVYNEAFERYTKAKNAFQKGEISKYPRLDVLYYEVAKEAGLDLTTSTKRRIAKMISTYEPKEIVRLLKQYPVIGGVTVTAGAAATQ